VVVMAEMEYRRLGSAGVRLSVLSFGSWVTFGAQMGMERALACMEAAHRAGVNFFDNAEVYAGGESERIMGSALAELDWPRHSYLISTKFFWGLGKGVNTANTLNRKYLHQAIEGSLERLGLDFVDLVFCHRPDPETPIEETVWAMHDMVDRGLALYWGTSEWPADAIQAAWDIARRHHLHPPQMEQPQYNLFDRHKVDVEFARLYGDIGLGLTTFSPLASGLLSGKYRQGIPEGSRGSLPGYGWLHERLTDEEQLERAEALRGIADDLGCTTAQLAIAWCAANPNVSSVITGASRPQQVEENMASLEVRQAIDDEVMERIDAAMA
jgi:voltage-dependent potassium channel beta subunit